MIITRLLCLCLCLALTACGASPPQSLPDASPAPDSTVTDANPCLAVEGLSCACGAALGVWRCAGAMPVCVCDRPDAQADTPDATDVIDAPPIACDVGIYCMQSGGCVNTSVNILHCGRCGNRCNAGEMCMEGVCASQPMPRDAGADVREDAIADIGLPCPGSTRDCNGDIRDGCEANIASGLAHCGACYHSCIARPNALAACVTGVCGIRCSVGWWDCDGNMMNGCETDTIGMQFRTNCVNRL